MEEILIIKTAAPIIIPGALVDPIIPNPSKVGIVIGIPSNEGEEFPNGELIYGVKKSNTNYKYYPIIGRSFELIDNKLSKEDLEFIKNYIGRRD